MKTKKNKEEIIIANLTEISPCLYCGKETLYFQELDKNGFEDLDAEPIVIPEDRFLIDITIDLLDIDDCPEDVRFFNFCCEEHFEKWCDKFFREKIFNGLREEHKKMGHWINMESETNEGYVEG